MSSDKDQQIDGPHKDAYERWKGVAAPSTNRNGNCRKKVKEMENIFRQKYIASKTKIGPKFKNIGVFAKRSLTGTHRRRKQIKKIRRQMASHELELKNPAQVDFNKAPNVDGGHDSDPPLPTLANYLMSNSVDGKINARKRRMKCEYLCPPSQKHQSRQQSTRPADWLEICTEGSALGDINASSTQPGRRGISTNCGA